MMGFDQKLRVFYQTYHSALQPHPIPQIISLEKEETLGEFPKNLSGGGAPQGVLISRTPTTGPSMNPKPEEIRKIKIEFQSQYEIISWKNGESTPKSITRAIQVAFGLDVNTTALCLRNENKEVVTIDTSMNEGSYSLSVIPKTPKKQRTEEGEKECGEEEEEDNEEGNILSESYNDNISNLSSSNMEEKSPNSENEQNDGLSNISDQSMKKRKRRRASEIDRRYKCAVPNCNKFYGSENALKMHLKLKHNNSHKIPQHSSIPQSNQIPTQPPTMLGYPSGMPVNMSTLSPNLLKSYPRMGPPNMMSPNMTSMSPPLATPVSPSMNGTSLMEKKSAPLVPTPLIPSMNSMNPMNGMNPTLQYRNIMTGRPSPPILPYPQPLDPLSRQLPPLIQSPRGDMYGIPMFVSPPKQIQGLPSDSIKPSPTITSSGTIPNPLLMKLHSNGNSSNNNGNFKEGEHSNNNNIHL